MTHDFWQTFWLLLTLGMLALGLWNIADSNKPSFLRTNVQRTLWRVFEWVATMLLLLSLIYQIWVLLASG